MDMRIGRRKEECLLNGAFEKLLLSVVHDGKCLQIFYKMYARMYVVYQRVITLFSVYLKR